MSRDTQEDPGKPRWTCQGWVKRATRHIVERTLSCVSPLEWLKPMFKPAGFDGVTDAYAVGVALAQAFAYFYLQPGVSAWAEFATVWLLGVLLLTLANIQLFHRERKEEHPEALELDPARSLILAAFNVVQIVFAFALLFRGQYARCQNSFDVSLPMPLISWTWVDYSVMTLTGFGDPRIEAIGQASRILVSAQVLLGLFMTVVVIANFASLLLPRDTASPSSGTGRPSTESQLEPGPGTRPRTAAPAARWRTRPRSSRKA